MSEKITQAGQAEGMPAAPDLTTIAGRVAAACQRFDLKAPTLAFDSDEPDAVLLTDDLQGFLLSSGLSFDWLCVGDPKGALTVDRRCRLQERKVLREFGRLEDDEKRLFIGLLVAMAEGDFEPEELVKLHTAALADLRAKKAAA